MLGLQTHDFVTGETLLIVQTKYVVAAILASQGFCLIPQKLIHSDVSDLLQIANETCSVCGPIAVVNMAEPSAREFGTLIAEGDLPFSHLLAISFQVRTDFVPASAAGAVRYFSSFPWDAVRKRQIRAAGTAVHSARSNLIFREKVGSHCQLREIDVFVITVGITTL